MKKSIEIKLDEKTITVSKLPLGRYAELLKQIKVLPTKLSSFKTLQTNEIVAQLPVLIGEAWPDFMAIIGIATDLKPDEIDNLGLDEAVNIIVAIVEVNNYKDVFDKIKKALARPQVKSTT
mgnify:CR=1 FL=1